MHTVIAFATGWGSKYGGINSFNTDFLSAFGAAYFGSVQVICIVPSATPDQIEKARNEHVCLIPLPFLPQEKTLSAAHALSAIAEMTKLGIQYHPDSTVWLGHDRMTGAAANAAVKAAGGRSALIHHMSYGHYESFAENSGGADEKTQMQKSLFVEADTVLAIGPLLRDALDDLLGGIRPIYMLIPGLAEIDTRNAPKTFTVFMSGRLDTGSSRIKQGHLGIAAFSQAHCEASKDGRPVGLCEKPKLVLRGVDFEAGSDVDQPSEQNDPEKILKEFAQTYAECVINLLALPFIHDRQRLYDDLRSSSVAMMPSWHEGFGLVGWEAIAAGVPLILSKDSGVYKLLQEKHAGAEQGFVYPVQIKGLVSHPYFCDADLRAVADKLKEIADDPGKARQRASNLRGLLEGYTWPDCAEQAVQAFGWTLQKGSIPLTLVSPVAPFPKTPIQQSAPPPTSTPPLQMPIKYWQKGQGVADSQLLRAEEELVPFDPARQPELDTLNTWLDDPKFSQAVRLLTGAGGVGKTRLALELCRRREEEGWHAGFLLADLEAKGMANAWGTLRGLDQPLLIVIDYAETRQAVLIALIKEILKVRGTQSVRILLLARNGGEWWDNLPSRESACEPILCGYATTGPYDLLPLHPTEQNRHDAYRKALQSFSEALGVSAPDVIPTLEGEHFERPLYVQMAALLALHGERPTTAEGLTRALLNHERRYWRGLLTSFGGVEPERYAQQLLAISTLTGGFATSRDAQSLVKAASLSPLPDGQFNALFNALAPLYPGKQGLQAVRPDLLGEALIAQALLSPEAPHLLDAVLSNKASATIRRHALTVLTRLATQRDDLHETLINALARNFSHSYKEIREVAIETNGSLPSLAEAAFTRLIPAQKNQIVGVLEPLVREESVQLAGFSCLVTEHLVEKFRKKMLSRHGFIDVQAYAGALINYSVCLHRVGREDASFLAAHKSLEYFERLKGTNKNRYNPSYAMSLLNYANRLADAGRNEDALVHAQKSLEIYQWLAQKSADDYESNYAMSLNNYSVWLAEGGRYEEALESARHSLEIRQRLAQKNPERYASDYAGTLSNYANRLGESGRDNEALEHARQALAINQRLAKNNPDRYEKDYASSLNNNAICLQDMGRREDALDYARQSLTIRQRLSDKNPDRYEAEYAGSLNTYANLLADNGLYEDALDYARQSLAIYQSLAEKFPNRFESESAMALNNYANRLLEAGRTEEASRCARQSMNIYQCLAQKNPDRYESDYTFSLNNYAVYLAKAGLYADALEHSRQSMEIYRRLAQRNPDRYDTDHATSLHNYTQKLTDTGQYEDALKNALAALEIYRRLAFKRPTRFEADLYQIECFVFFLSWIFDGVADETKTGSPSNLPKDIPLHRQLLLRFYLSFIEACQQSMATADSKSFAQARSLWDALSLENKIQAQPYWLCVTAWCEQHAPELVAELDWQSDLNEYARQRQGNLPQWMLTVAVRLDFSFDLSQIVTAAPQNVLSDGGVVPCPSV